MPSKLITRCGFIVLLILTAALITFGIIIEQHYLTHYQTTNCSVDSCQSIPGTCFSCGNIKCSYYVTIECTYLLYNYTLYYNDKPYIKEGTLLPQTCPETVPCYYLQESVGSSLIDDLALKRSSHLEGIFIKVIHTLVYLVPIGWVLFGGYFLWFEILPTEKRLDLPVHHTHEMPERGNHEPIEQIANIEPVQP